MQRYLNLGRDSGVAKFRIYSDCIFVEFSDSAQYEYTASSIGNSNLETMKSA